MVAAGYENYVLWITLREIKSKLGKGLDAVYAAYLATEAVSSETEKVAAFVALGRELEKVKRGDEAREAYDMADEHAVGRAYELIAHARSLVERATAYMELCRALKAIKRDSEALGPCDKASELLEDAAELSEDAAEIGH